MAAPLTPSPAGGAPILVVDDKPEKLVALRAVLEDLGEEVVEARSGRDALRQLLAREFAVVLLDVNMPGIDGFETAALIRQRRLSEHTPIIFITAYSDDTHVARGYSLGAVDYIVAPVHAEVLRTKVAVFVDLYRKAAQIRAQAESLEHRADQLHRLTRSSLAINAALSLEAMLRVVVESARTLLGAREACVTAFADDPAVARRAFIATGDGTEELAATGCGDRHGAVPSPSSATVQSSPDGKTLWAPLTRRDGTVFGWIHAVHPPAGAFGADDEALLVTLAQMAAIATENSLSSDLREANRLKDEFLTTLSHELRTPLSAVLGWTHILRNESLDSSRLAHAVEVIERNVHSQARLVDDLLDISRITLGKLRLARKTLSLRTLLSDAIDGCRPAALEKGLSIGLAGGPGAGGGSAVFGDPERLHQVFTNLLSNAVKFTPAGGHVAVSLRPAEGGWDVEVRDDGVGISPAFLGVVFERFRQADGSSTRSHAGLGIGLAIVRHIVEAHGGTVKAESDGSGKGATFTVFLPAARAVEAEDDAPEGISAEDHDLAGVRILLVDDDADGRDAVAELLASCGAEVTQADSMRDALARLKPTHDVLVSDIGMPGGDGYELLSRIRSLPSDEGGEIPAIALTAYARPDDRRRALDAGFLRHVPKPLDAGFLVAAIHSAVRRDAPDERRRPLESESAS